MVLSVVVSFGKTNGLCIGTQVLPNSKKVILGIFMHRISYDAYEQQLSTVIMKC